MRRDLIRLSRRHRGWIYATGVALLVSGAVWLLIRKWWGDEFGPGAELATAAMKLHGAAAMLSLVLLGTLLPGHVRQAWHARRNRWTGGGVLAGTSLLIVTGYGLYYLGGETAREITSVIHWGVGLVLPLAVVWHVRVGRRPVARRRLHSVRAPHVVSTPPPETLATSSRVRETPAGNRTIH